MDSKFHPLAFARGLVAMLSIGSSFVYADTADDRIRISGFGTVAVVNAGDEGFEFRRDISRNGLDSDGWGFETDSLLGLQLDARLTTNLDTSLQLVGRDRPEDGIDESLEWAFVRYRPTSDISLRGGRLGVDIFMLSDYRNVGFAYLWVRPPVEFYGPIAYESVDGADLVFTRQMDDGLFRIKLFGGYSSDDFSTPTEDSYSVDLVSYGTTLSWEFDHWQTRLGMINARVKNTVESSKPLLDALNAIPTAFWPEAAQTPDTLDSKNKRIKYLSLGTRYDNFPWSVQAEVGYVDSQLPTLPVLNSYVSIGRRSAALTPYAVFAIVDSPGGRKIAPEAPFAELQALQQGIQTSYDTTYINQHSLSLGVRWDLRHNIALKTQWDHHWIAAYGGGLWAQQPAS